MVEKALKGTSQLAKDNLYGVRKRDKRTLLVYLRSLMA